MFRLPKKLKNNEINHLYKNINEAFETVYSDSGWVNFLSYFYDADYVIESLDSEEFNRTKNSAVHNHFRIYGVEEILNLKSFQNNLISKKFAELKNQFPGDFEGFFDEWFEEEVWRNSCLSKDLKIDSNKYFKPS